MNRSTLFGVLAVFASLTSSLVRAEDAVPKDLSERDLVGHWTLQGDCRDHSGNGNDGVNHGVDLATSNFDGRGAYVEVPTSKSLQLGRGDFSFSAWVRPKDDNDDVVGDVLDLYDPSARRGVTLSINSSAGGYQGQGNDRHVYFGIDQARLSDWEDCGRPSPTSNYVSNSLTVFQGHLYAGVTDAQKDEDKCHVFRYEGAGKWSDCGRVGQGKTTGVGPMVVHDNALYVATWTYDWTRVTTGDYDAGRLYRYAGGTRWEDCGQPSNNRTLTGSASFAGRLFLSGGPDTWGIFVREKDGQWKPSQLFPTKGMKRCFPHTMCRFNGQLFTANHCAYVFDGKTWTYAGLPAGDSALRQTHSMTVYQGKLIAGTWPRARVMTYEGGDKWRDIGRVGEDGTEVNSLIVYNGQLYGGSIPRAEVCRYDGKPQWTMLKRFYSPAGWTPFPPDSPDRKPTRAEINEWTRVTGLTIHRGKLFASIGSCTSSVLDAPPDVRGKVFCCEAGKCVSYDDDLGSGWKHLTALRSGRKLKLYIDGKLVAESTDFKPDDYDLSTRRPLRIGFGQSDSFAGQIRDVRLYRRSLTESEIRTLSLARPLDSPTEKK